MWAWVCSTHWWVERAAAADIGQLLWHELPNPEMENFISLMQAAYLYPDRFLFARVKFSNNSKVILHACTNFCIYTFDCINFSTQNCHPPPRLPKTKSKCVHDEVNNFIKLEIVRTIKHIWLMHCMWKSNPSHYYFASNCDSNQIRDYDGDIRNGIGFLLIHSY